MPLPLSRDFDAVDAGPLPHTTVNALQDAIVAGGHGPIWVQKNIYGGEPLGSPSFTILGRWQATIATDTVDIPLDFPVGTTIEQIRCHVYDPGGAGSNLSMEFSYKYGLAGDNVIDTFAGNATLSLKEYVFDVPDTVVITHRRYILKFFLGRINGMLLNVECLVSKS
jgi:hypothetical protein